MTTPRPIQHLNAILKPYPEVGRFVDSFRSDRVSVFSRLPDWCFLPMSAWYSIINLEAESKTEKVRQLADLAPLAAIGTWRYSQGIYSINPALMDALSESRISGNLPSEVFFRLPEWSVYIETPRLHWMDLPLYGFWVHLEHDANNARNEMRFLFDCEGGLIPFPIHLGSWTVTEAVERAIAEATKQAQLSGIEMNSSPLFVREIAANLNPLISILLYLCSEEPEIDDLRSPGNSPSYPSPKKTKKGWRFFAPDKPKFWSVGESIGEKLHQSILSNPTGRTVKTHLRRGHWHGFWTGTRRFQQKFVYHWISPLVVGGNEESRS